MAKETIQQLREHLQELSKQARNVLADKGSAVWSKDDQAKFDGLMDDSERLQQQIDAHQRLMDADAEKRLMGSKDIILKPDGTRKFGDTPKGRAMEGLEIFLRSGTGDNPRFPLTAEQKQKVMNTLSTTTGSQGGFTMESLVASEMVDLLKAYGWMRAVSSQISTEKGNPLTYPTSDGTSEVGEWVAQNTTATALDPVFGSVAVNPFKASSKVIAVPIELLQDSQIDITKMVMKRMRDRIGRIANQGFTTGGGATTPQGFVGVSATGKVGLTGQTLSVIYDDLADLVDSLDAAYLTNDGPTDMSDGVEDVTGGQVGGVTGIGFMMAQSSRRVVRKLKDTQGRPLWMPSYAQGIGGGFPDQLLGYDLYLNNDMAAMAANAFSIAFGNFKRYLIRDVMDVTMFRFDDSAYMKLGQVGFLAWARVGGNLLDVNSLKLYQNSAT